MSGIRAGTGLPDQRQAGCAKCCGAYRWHFYGVPVANPDKDACCVGSNARPYRASLSGTLIVACRSTSAQTCDDFDELLLRLVSMLDLHLFRFVKTAKFGELLDGPAFVGHPNFANLQRDLVGLTEP
jgi:hypothetical protein